MSAIILGWNPDVWNDWDYNTIVAEVNRTGRRNETWSVGNHVNIARGADAWLYRQGKQALHNAGCRWGLNPPASSRDLAT